MELGPGGTVFPKGIQSAGPKIGPDRTPYDTVTLDIIASDCFFFLGIPSIHRWLCCDLFQIAF